MAHPSLVDLKREHDGPELVNAPTGPHYPYGCCISLDEETLKKLGLDGDPPEVGDMICFTAHAKVTAVTHAAHEAIDGGEKKTRVELQITEMGVADGDEGEDRAAKWYGHGEPDGDEA